MNLDELSIKYMSNQQNLINAKEGLVSNINEILRDTKHIDTISGRVKELTRFIKKAGKENEGRLKYTYPLTEIQDQIGVRIVVFYKSDVEVVRDVIHNYFNPIEFKAYLPDDPSKFKYEAMHFILVIPDDYRNQDLSPEECPEFFELQIHTLFQHALAEAGHNLAYKPSNPLNIDQERKVAFVAAQAWGADFIFDDLYKEIGTND